MRRILLVPLCLALACCSLSDPSKTPGGDSSNVTITYRITDVNTAGTYTISYTDQTGTVTKAVTLPASVSSLAWSVTVSCTPPLQLDFSVTGSRVQLVPSTAGTYNTITSRPANGLTDAATDFNSLYNSGVFRIGDIVDGDVTGEKASIINKTTAGSPHDLLLDSDISGWASTRYRIVKRQSATLEILWNGDCFIPCHPVSSEVIDCTLTTHI